MSNCDFESMKRAIADALVAFDGDTYVRSVVAARILAMRPSQLREEELRGRLKTLRRRVQPDRSTVRGLEVWYSARDLLDLACRRTHSRHRRPWTEAERKRLTRLLVTHSIAEIAAILQRTPRAIRHELQHGGMRRRLRQEGRLITVSALAALCNHSVSGIHLWTQRFGCPCERTPGGQRMFDLAQVHAWLTTQPAILERMDPFTRRKLRVSVFDLQQQEAV